MNLQEGIEVPGSLGFGRQVLGFRCRFYATFYEKAGLFTPLSGS